MHTTMQATAMSDVTAPDSTPAGVFRRGLELIRAKDFAGWIGLYWNPLIALEIAGGTDAPFAGGAR
ncbi:hypothetical protein [Streptomyces sp. NPDC029674]|uniref:hypothetical protein n=1 Tax=Streptomyces sp. NPDC029674 TaxID=3365297 RepID=UPI00384E107F